MIARGTRVDSERHMPLRNRAAATLLLFVLLVVAYLIFSPRLFNDGDTSWHLAAGQLILDTHSVPESDPFSLTAASKAWTAHEWLAEVAMAAAFRAASWGGVAVLSASAVGGLLLLLGAELHRRLPLRHLVVTLALALAVLAPFTLSRPHVLAWPLLAGWTILLLRAREAHRAPSLPFAMLMIVWSNLHASFVLGLALVAVFALEALVEETDRGRALRDWTTFGLLSLAATLLTPHGLQGLLYPLQVSSMKALPMIMEWRPTTLAQDGPFLAIVAGTALLLLLHRVRVPLVRAVLIAGLLYLAASHVRHQPLVAVLGPLLLAEPLSRRSGHTPQLLPAWLPIMFALGVLLLAAVRIPLSLPRDDSASNPVTAIAHLPAALRRRPVLNSYGFGGPLILAGVRPFIDGRGDMYGDAFMFEHARVIDGDRAAFARAVRQWGIGWTILEPDAPLVRLLDNSPGWRRAYADQWAIVHVRR